MPATYSINPGTPTEANKLIDLNSVLNELPDNVTNLIDPHDLRDAVYTAWENIVIKPTTNSADIEYIGVDRSDLYEKIFLGKKQVSGSDILTSSLLNSDIDLFIYNTKNDVDLNNQNTKIAFLAGASSSIFYYGGTISVPFIETKVINTISGNVLDFNIKNNSYVFDGVTYSGGNISIESKYGNILVNGLVFPSVAQNSTTPDGQVLQYKNIGGTGYLQWGSVTASVTDIYTTSTFSITANPLIINGYNAMFSNSVPTLIDLGGIPAGSTFSNVAVTQMLNMLLYPYIAPSVTLTSPVSFMEISSSSQTINFSYSITKYIASSTISTIGQIPTIITSTSPILTYLNVPTGNLTYYANTSYVSTYFSTAGIKSFTLSVTDNLGGSASANYAVNAIYPIFYGTAFTASVTQSTVQGLLPSFTKLLSNDPNQTVPMSGNGVCLYYCVPNIYNTSTTMSALYDSNSPLFDIKNVFRGTGMAFTMSLNSPSSYWSGVLYNCYIYSPGGTPNITTIGYPTLYNANYQFVF